MSKYYMIVRVLIQIFRGSFSGHGGYGHDQGCSYCAKLVWIGVAALAIQVFLMQQAAGGGKKKRKRRDIEDLYPIEFATNSLPTGT